MKTGTCHFPSYGAAIRYYRPYVIQGASGSTTDAVRSLIDAKLNSGEIHIGPPALKAGETLTIEDNRFFINSP